MPLEKVKESWLPESMMWAWALKACLGCSTAPPRKPELHLPPRWCAWGERVTNRMQPWAMAWKSQSPRPRQNLPKSLPHALEKARASQARPWLMNPNKGNLGLISSRQMLTIPSQDLTFKVGWRLANCISLLRWLRICPSTTLPLLVRSGAPWKRTTWQKLKPWPWGRNSWKSTVHRPWHMFLERACNLSLEKDHDVLGKDMHARGKGPSAAEVHQQFWKKKGRCCYSTGCKVIGCIVLARNLVASGGHRVTACWLVLNACLQPCLSRLHAWPCHHTCYMHTRTHTHTHTHNLHSTAHNLHRHTQVHQQQKSAGKQQPL